MRLGWEQEVGDGVTRLIVSHPGLPLPIPIRYEPPRDALAPAAPSAASAVKRYAGMGPYPDTPHRQKVGKDGEYGLAWLLRQRGLTVEHPDDDGPYDLLVNGRRIDVKTRTRVNHYFTLVLDSHVRRGRVDDFVFQGYWGGAFYLFGYATLAQARAGKLVQDGPAHAMSRLCWPISTFKGQEPFELPEGFVRMMIIEGEKR